MSSTEGVISDSGSTSIRQTLQTSDQYKCNAQSHDQCCKVMFMVGLCGQFHLQEVGCKGICKITSNLNLKEVHMHICLCSPNLYWSNMKTKSILRILAFF